MIYNAYKPAPALGPFIDAYWHLSGHLHVAETLTLLPSGGINLLVNLGETITSTRFAGPIGHGGVYVVGPMMQTDIQILHGDVLLFGISFKPGAFMHFYQYESLDRITDQFLEFQRKDFPDIKKSIQHFLSFLDQFYLDRLSSPRSSILPIASDISLQGGQVKIDSLVKKHFTTARQLERQFKQQVGLSPKEFINLERFNTAFSKLQNRSQQSLSEIAEACGYYDHAHLTNDFKRYTGHPPTAFILSDFSKKLAGESP